MGKTRGTVDGKGGLTLSYREPAATAATGTDDAGSGKPLSSSGVGWWELGSKSGGCLYRHTTSATTPASLVGNLPWERSYGGAIHIPVMISAKPDGGGWIDPGILAFDQQW